MPAMTLRFKLRAAMGARTVNAIAEIAGVGPQQIHNLLGGRTEPWDVRVSTAQRLVEAFPIHLRITDFYRGRSEDKNQMSDNQTSRGGEQIERRGGVSEVSTEDAAGVLDRASRGEPARRA